jgi:hypothetical protein
LSRPWISYTLGSALAKNMSDNWLQLIPNDPLFRPTPENAEHARRLLASFVPDADEVSSELKPGIEFFDPGGNWSGVECPVCGVDAEEWWAEAMDSAHAGGFSNLLCVAGCCGAEVSLNEMRYLWPAAFGSFALVAMNPDIRSLSVAQQDQIEKQLGCALRAVWTHL